MYDEFTRSETREDVRDTERRHLGRRQNWTRPRRARFEANVVSIWSLNLEFCTLKGAHCRLFVIAFVCT